MPNSLVSLSFEVNANISGLRPVCVSARCWAARISSRVTLDLPRKGGCALTENCPRATSIIEFECRTLGMRTRVELVAFP